MNDIVERLRSFHLLSSIERQDIMMHAAKEIESLRKQLEELTVNHKAELVMRDQNSQMYLDNTRQQLAETRDASRSVADYNLELINQLAEAEALRVCADHDANELAKQLTEYQARDKVLIRYLELIANVNAMDYEYKSWARVALDMPAEKLK